MDIAELAFKVDSTALTKGVTELDKTTAAAGRTQTATQKLEKDVVKLQMSQKQLLQAQRQLPMQFTDIFVSLASGQRPMQVMLQQGGQLKDVFGGVGPALRGMAGYVAGLINPVTLAAAGVGALAIAWNQASDEAAGFNRALIQSGGYAGRSAEQMQMLAMELDNISGVTQNSASKAITAVAGTGRFAGEQFEMVSRAATKWSAATGESVDDVVSRFVKLADDPVKAILELHKSQNFLTKSTMQQIDKLVEQGRTTDAVALSIKTLSGVIDERAPKMEANLGNVEWAIRGIKNEARDAADAVIGLFRASNDTSRLKELQSNIDAQQKLIGNQGWWNGGGVYGGMSDKQLEAGIARAKAQMKSITDRPDFSNVTGGEKVDLEARKALEEFNSAEARYMTESQRKLIEKSKVQDLLTKGIIDQAAATKRLGEIDAYYSRKAPKGRKASETDPTDGILKRLQQQILLNEEQAKSVDRLTGTERMLLSIQVELDALGKKATPQRRSQIAVLMEQARATDAVSVATEKARKAEESLTRQRAIFDQAASNSDRSNEIDLLGIGRGSQAMQMLERQLAIQREYYDELKRLGDRSVADDKLTWDRMAGNAQLFRNAELEKERRHQAAMANARADWTKGAASSLENYINNASNIAGQVEGIFDNTLSSTEDALTDFFTKGKADWRGYFDSIAADITRMQVRQGLSKFAAKFLPGLKGGTEADAMSKSASELAAASVPLYGAAAALSASAAALAAAGIAGGLGSSGSSGGSMWDLFGNMGSSGSGGDGFQSAITAGAGLFGGGRANGGDVFGDQYYRVGENNHPELLNMGQGNQFLIPGDRGRVEPITGGGGGVTVNQTIQVTGKADKRTATNLARQSAESMKMAQRTS